MTVRTSCIASAAAILLAGVGQASAGDLLFSQPRQPGGVAGISLTTGGNVFSFANRRLADNFSASSGITIESVRWWGGSETSAGDSLANLAGFEIEIYADNAGLPGAPVFTESVSLGAAGATQIPGETQGILGAAMYQFEASLSIPAVLPAGDYWLSIAGDVINPVDFTNEAFQWVGSSVDSDGTIAQDRFDGQGYQLQTLSIRDTAFELIGVPTPGAAGVLAVAGLAAARRRRA